VRSEIQEAIEYMSELEGDSSVPRNIKAKISSIIASLKNTKDEELSLTVNKLLSDLDEISSDANLDQFTRQQIWSISSMLEGINV
jgi:uncharacterized protein (UPF0147 family)